MKSRKKVKQKSRYTVNVLNFKHCLSVLIQNVGYQDWNSQNASGKILGLCCLSRPFWAGTWCSKYSNIYHTCTCKPATIILTVETEGPLVFLGTGGGAIPGGCVVELCLLLEEDIKPVGRLV